MADIYNVMKEYIAQTQMIDKSDSVLAAVSGGADSMCMLSLLIEYSKEKNLKLGVININHGFRPEASIEADYIKEYCMEKQIPFFLKEIKPGECAKSEESAREYRYKLIAQTAKENGYTRIALAHNANDRAETLMFNIYRGTGLRGLASIRPLRDQYIRPLLGIKREDIENYLSEKNIKYYTDSTNLEDSYDRNKIRHHIIPTACTINSRSIEHMNELSDYMDRLNLFIQKTVSEKYDLLVKENKEGYSIGIEELNSLDELIASELLRYVLTSITPKLKDITSEHINDILMLSRKEDNGRVDLPYNIRVFKEYEVLFISNKTDENGSLEEVPINISEIKDSGKILEKFYLDKKINVRVFARRDISGDLKEHIPTNKYTKWFDYDKITSSVCIRKREEKDFLYIDLSGHRKTVSRYMIEAKIPERLREEIPVIAMGDEILWIPGYRESYAYRIDDNTQYILEMDLEEQ